MRSPGASETMTKGPDRPSASSIVEGEITGLVRAVRVLITALVAAALIAGIVRFFTSADSGTGAAVDGLLVTQASLAAILVLLGSLVEGFGFGLSLGTNWPYTRNVLVLLVRGDPEAAHRIVATLVGLIAVALVVLRPDSLTINGLILIVLTAALGIGTLHVLAGRLPSIVHGAHGLLAYGVFLAYAFALVVPEAGFWSHLRETVPLHALLLTVFLGGMTTGQRGFGQPIGAFTVPRRLPQMVLVVHIIAALAVVGTLGWLMPQYPLAFYLSVAQVLVGLLLVHAVNLTPKAPGILVGLHQAMVLAIALAIVVASG